MDRLRHLILTAALVCVSALTAFAQQPAAPAAPPPPREGTAEFSFVGTSGNSSTQAIGLGGEFTLRRASWVYNTKLAYVRNESADELTAQSLAARFEATRMLTDRLGVFGRYAFLRNEFAGIDNRNSVAGGIEYLVIRPEPHRLKLNAGVGYANEQRLIGQDLSAAEFVSGAGYKWTISPNADITDDFEFTASFDDGSDWRTANIAAVTAKLTTVLALKLSNTVRYVHAPVIGFETTDTITSIALVAKF